MVVSVPRKDRNRSPIGILGSLDEYRSSAEMAAIIYPGVKAASHVSCRMCGDGNVRVRVHISNFRSLRPPVQVVVLDDAERVDPEEAEPQLYADADCGRGGGGRPRGG